MSDTFTVYGSLSDTVFKIKDLKLRAEVAEAILYFGAYGEVPEGLSEMADIILTPIFPVITSAKTRRADGGKGGRPAKSSTAGAKKPGFESDERGVLKTGKGGFENVKGRFSENENHSIIDQGLKTKDKDQGLKTEELDQGEKQTKDGKSVNMSARKRAFRAPTIEEVRAYCTERHNAVDPERFVDYYESNGWHVGKNPMKDWQAAVRTWERGDNGGQAYRQTARSGTTMQSQLDVAAQMIEKFHQEENEQHEP